jgi:uncharacterized protein (DUF1330 family)
MNKMKTLTFLTNSVLAMVLAATFSVQAQMEKSAMDKGHKCNGPCADHGYKTQALSFKKGKVYELAFADVIPSKMDQLNNAYFPKALVLAAKYGGKMLGGFGVVKNESALLPSNMVAIFEWPSTEARLKLLKDAEFKKIVPIRDAALKKINLGYFTVAEDKVVQFRSDKVYEFGSVDMKAGDEAQMHLKKYFEVSEPIKRNYGGQYPEFVLNLISIDSNGQGTFKPHMQFIVEWDSLEDNAKLFANEAFRTKAAPLMMQAIQSADFVFTKFSFEP